MRVQIQCKVGLYKLLKTKIMKVVMEEEEQVEEKFLGVDLFFTVGMEDVLLLHQVHQGHFVVEAFY